MQQKWFYPLQKIAEEKIKELYPQSPAQVLNYQEITSDRVFEQRTISLDGTAVKEIMVVMRKNTFSVFIYEMNFVASN